MTGAKIADIPDFSVMDFPQAGENCAEMLGEKTPNGGEKSMGLPIKMRKKRSGFGIIVICPESRIFGFCMFSFHFDKAVLKTTNCQC